MWLPKVTEPIYRPLLIMRIFITCYLVKGDIVGLSSFANL